MGRFLTCIVACVGLVVAVTVASAAPAETSRSSTAGAYVAGRILVQPRQGDLSKANDLAGKVGGKVAATLPALRIVALDVAADDTDKALAELQADPAVAFAERDPLIQTAAPATGWRPNDPLLDSEWGLARIGVAEAWDVTRGDSSLIVAVLDTGIDTNHPDLQGQFVGGWDFVGKDSVPQDDNGHGTHVSGLVAAAADNGRGISGVAPGARVMPIKVVTATGIGSHLQIAQGIEYAVHNGARILNLSLGGSEPSETLRRAVAYAWDSGALVVAAAGNENSSAPVYPAAWPNVIGVGATNVDDTRAPFSNFGGYVAISAPGVAILSTTMGGSYEAWPGTSMATPLVSGVAALLWSRYPNLTNAEVRALLLETTDHIGSASYDGGGWNAEYGHGLVNAARAVGLTIATPTPGPARPSPTPTACPIPGLLPEEQAVVNWINAARQTEGLPALNVDMRLSRAARAHSQDMADRGALTHTGSDGSSLQARIARAGYQASEVSELLAGAEGNPRSLVNLWLNSSAHRQVLLAPWDDVGVGLATAPGTSYYFYWTVKLASRQQGAPVATPVSGVCPTGVAATATATPRPPTATPTLTPTPDGLTTIELRPAPGGAGWVRSDQPDVGNWGDDDTYSGSLGAVTYHGAVQFDLGRIPPNARIQRAQLRLTGQDASQRRGGTWAVRLLGTDADYGWTSHGYAVVHGVSVVDTVGELGAGDLGEGVTNTLDLTVGQVLELQQRRASTGQVSFRFDGPTSGDSLFSWDTGQGNDSTQPGPALVVGYALSGPPEATATPATPVVTPTPTATLPRPTATPPPTPGPEGDVTLQIEGRPADGGWVVSGEARGNHLGDDDIYVGVFDGAVYLGAIQFDLSAVPPDARINWATLFILGRSARYTLPGGAFQVSILDTSSDLAWSSLTYSRLWGAGSVRALPPALSGDQLHAGEATFVQFDAQALAELKRRSITTRRLSLRLDGPSSGGNNLFSWNSGASGPPPVLTINYAPGLSKRSIFR